MDRFSVSCVTNPIGSGGYSHAFCPWDGTVVQCLPNRSGCLVSRSTIGCAGKGTYHDNPFAHYRLALRLDPTHRGAHETIGEAYLMDGKPAEARRHLAELERLCGNRTCEEYGDLAGAIDRYRAPSR